MTNFRLPTLWGSSPLDDMFRGMLRPASWDYAPEPPPIKIDVAESDAAYTVKAELPGVRKEDINVRVDRNQVSISAEVKREHEEKKDGRILRQERYQGFVSRVFSLANDVDDAKAAAKFENGVLNLTLPKKTTARSERLPIL
jgi:HSP20 family protein